MGNFINTSIKICKKEIINRVVFQPMEGCDCELDGTPSNLTREKYIKAAKSGAGLVWFEACAVCPEGRTNSRQMMLTQSNLPHFKALIDEMRETAKRECGISPIFILQLTHSGRQSIVPMIAYRHPIYDKMRSVSDDNIVSDEYLDTLPEKYANSSRLVTEAGFDGIDVKSCHGYMLQELLSAFTRRGKYGGSFECRTRLYIDCLRSVRNVLSDGHLLTTRLGVADMVPRPFGFGTDEENNIDFSEPDRLIAMLINSGVSILNVTVGNPYFNPHVNRPYRKGEYISTEAPEVGIKRFAKVEKHIKDNFPSLFVVASGLSYYRTDLIEQSEQLLADGVCDLVGYGRMSLAYPMFYRDYLTSCFDAQKCCVACSKCTELMRNKCVSGCAVYNDYYKKLYEENVLCKKSQS